MSVVKRGRSDLMAPMLREQGIDLPNLATGESVCCGKKSTINPIGMRNYDRDKYKLCYTYYDMNQCCSRFIWKNLPNGLTSWNLERMLYFRGSLCAFHYGGLVYILPYVATGEVNLYGFPTRVQPISYNGQDMGNNRDYFRKDFELNVDNFGDENSNYDAVLLWDGLPYGGFSQGPSRFAFNQIIINDIAETLARVHINLVVSNKKIMLVIKDPKQREVVEMELQRAFGSDSPWCVLSSELDIQEVQNSNDYNADDLFNTMKNYDAIRCFMSGIASKGFGAEKKERLVTGELAGAQEEKDLILDMGFDLRKMFCDQCNAKFGTNISVIKRSDLYREEAMASTELNGNNQNADEEAEGGYEI